MCVCVCVRMCACVLRVGAGVRVRDIARQPCTSFAPLRLRLDESLACHYAVLAPNSNALVRSPSLGSGSSTRCSLSSPRPASLDSSRPRHPRRPVVAVVPVAGSHLSTHFILPQTTGPPRRSRLLRTTHARPAPSCPSARPCPCPCPCPVQSTLHPPHRIPRPTVKRSHRTRLLLRPLASPSHPVPCHLGSNLDTQHQPHLIPPRPAAAACSLPLTHTIHRARLCRW